MERRRLLLNAFSMNCVSHIQQGLWVRDDTEQLNYKRLEPWVALARILESGCFDALFLADVSGVYDAYRGSAETSIRTGMQIPSNDPMLLIPAMAQATEHLGFAFTSNILQAHPFQFARQMSTLDHLTDGRVAWNIVTSYLPNAVQNLGVDALPEHDQRYDWADEYLEVVYKLWEGSWEADAVLADAERGVYADPAKVHAINHHGRYFDCAGPHLCEPSPQRTPLLFQAGASERGREFAARHAECMFIMASRKALAGENSVIRDVKSRAERLGRHASSIRFFQGLSPVVGGSDAEARTKEAEYLEQLSIEAALAHLSGSLAVDLSTIDPDAPLDSIDVQGTQSIVRNLIDTAPPGTRTLGELARANLAGHFLTGSPERIADVIEQWYELGVDGLNLVYAVTPGTFADFIEAVVPILQRRGLVQSAYRTGTLREKVFGYPLLPEEHTGARYRDLGRDVTQ
jgi:FMN-dependent oxidoreductase (nitrilotriacetate monooxygenase family)